MSTEIYEKEVGAPQFIAALPEHQRLWVI